MGDPCLKLLRVKQSLVDDEPAPVLLIFRCSRRERLQPFDGRPGAAALQILESDVPIDLLLSDVGLPGTMNGRWLADEARKVRPNLKVLFITGFAESAVVGHGHLEPGMQVLTKPFEITGLATRLRELIDS